MKIPDTLIFSGTLRHWPSSCLSIFRISRLESLTCDCLSLMTALRFPLAGYFRLSSSDWLVKTFTSSRESEVELLARKLVNLASRFERARYDFLEVFEFS